MHLVYTTVYVYIPNKSNNRIVVLLYAVGNLPHQRILLKLFKQLTTLEVILS